MKTSAPPARPVPIKRPASEPTSPAAEKRTAPRHRRRHIATVEDHPWFTTDVGPGGFGAEASVLPRRGTRISGLIRGKVAVVPFSGQVAWVLPGNMHLSQRGRVGVKFIRVAPALAGLLDEQGAAEGGGAQQASSPPRPSQDRTGLQRPFTGTRAA